MANTEQDVPEQDELRLRLEQRQRLDLGPHGNEFGALTGRIEQWPAVLIESRTDQCECHIRAETEHDTSGNAGDNGSKDTGFHRVTFLTLHQSLLRPRGHRGVCHQRHERQRSAVAR